MVFRAIRGFTVFVVLSGLAGGFPGSAPAQTVDLSITDPVTIAAQCGGDGGIGRSLFDTRCAVCHSVAPEPAPGFGGPSLYGLFGRKAGSVPDGAYSAALAGAGAAGLVWERETLRAYLGNPAAFLPGGGKAGSGLADEQQVQDVMTYLRLATAPPPPLPGTVPVPETLLALEGDRDYGEYLASECVACHHGGDGGGGIPSIDGLDRTVFLTALHEYRIGARPNPVMQTIVGRMSDEELAALAAYFTTAN